MRAIASRDFSPPESARIFLSTSSPENWNAPATFRGVRPETIAEPLFFGKHGLLPCKCCLLIALSHRSFALVEVVVTRIGWPTQTNEDISDDTRSSRDQSREATGQKSKKFIHWS